MQVKKTTLLWGGIGLLVVLGVWLFMGDASSSKVVVFETTAGTFEITLASDMNITTDNFKTLVGKGFYDGTRFHRVIEGFMVQGGDPLSKDLGRVRQWGTGGPGYTIKDEFGSLQNVRGTIAMANAGPNTGGSQFFINVVDNMFLNGKHPVFGKVTKGMDVVDAIVSTPTDAQDRPVKEVVVKKVYLK